MPFLVVANQSYSLNSCHQIHLWIALLVTLIKLFFLVNSQMQFGEITNFNFFQLYHCFVVITEKYNGDLFRRSSYKRLKSFQFFYEGHIKTMGLCITELFIYVYSKVKFSTKNKCYNVIVKFIRESEDIILLLVLVLLDQVSSVLENSIMLVLFFLLWKILEVFDVYISAIKMECSS